MPSPQASPIRCLMRFEQIFDRWEVTVLRDGRTVRELRLADAGRLEEMARRGGGLRNLEARNLFELAVRQKRGATELFLTVEQWARLMQR